MTPDPDAALRVAAFAALDVLQDAHGKVLAGSTLESGFVFRGEKIHFQTRAKGIFRARQQAGRAPLSVKTTVPRKGRTRRYDDGALTSGTFHYKMRGSDPQHPDNRGLRAAYEERIPLIYFFGVAPGQYYPLYPTFVAGVDASGLSCELSVHGDALVGLDEPWAEPGGWAAEPRYAESVVKRRLHQAAFRHHVLHAYRNRCAICSLPEPMLLEAAHIVADARGGSVQVSNGLSLCSLHHRAFDSHLLGIKPNGEIHIPERVLKLRDGPTLEHGIKGFNGRELNVPRAKDDRPDPDFLAERYTTFLKKAG